MWITRIRPQVWAASCFCPSVFSGLCQTGTKTTRSFVTDSETVVNFEWDGWKIVMYQCRVYEHRAVMWRSRLRPLHYDQKTREIFFSERVASKICLNPEKLAILWSPGIRPCDSWKSPFLRIRSEITWEFFLNCWSLVRPNSLKSEQSPKSVPNGKRITNRSSYVDGATHHGLSLDGLHHDLEEVGRTLVEVEHLGHTAAEVFHRLAARAALQVLVRTVHSASEITTAKDIYISTDFGVYSPSRFPSTARTNKHRDKVTDTTEARTKPVLSPAWVIAARVSEESHKIGRVRPSTRAQSECMQHNFWTNRPLTLIFGAWMTTARGGLKVEVIGRWQCYG